MAQRKRPVSVTIIAILFIINGIGSLVMAMYVVIIFTFYFVGTPSEIIKLSMLFGYILTAFATTSFLTASGILKGKRWAWIIGIILVVVQLIFVIIGIPLIFVDNDIVDISGVDMACFIIACLTIWYLYRPNVKKYFETLKIQAH